MRVYVCILQILKKMFKMGDFPLMKNSIKQLKDKCSKYQDIEPEKAILLAKEVLQYSKKENDKENEIYSLFFIGETYFINENFKEAIKWLKKIVHKGKNFKNSITFRDANRLIAKSYKQVNDFTSPINYLLSSLDWNENNNLLQEIADDQMEIGMLYFMTSNFSEGIEYSNRAYDIFFELNDNEGMNFVNLNLGNCYSILGNFDKALSYNLKATEYAELLKDPTMIANCFNNVSITYKELGEFQKAIDNSLKSILIKEKLKQPVGLIYGNIGVIYKEWGNLDRCIYYYNKAIKFNEKEGDKSSLANMYANSGNLFFEKKEYEKALDSFFKSLSLNREIKNIPNEIVNLTSIGKINISFKTNYIEAERYFNDALEIARELNNKESIILVTLNLVNLYSTINKLDKSKKLLGTIPKYLKSVKSYKLELEYYNHSIDFHRLRNESDKEAEFLRKIIALKDKVFTIEKKNKVNELEIRFEIDKKEQEVEIYRVKSTELSKKNEEIKKQKEKLEETLEELNKSNLKFNIIEKELDKSFHRELIGKSPQIKSILELVSTVAKSNNTNVLITGESGTGKEIIARLIHKISKRGRKSFYGVNSSAVPDSLFESQFFGHEKNSFTGADKTHIGWFEFADKSTLFLDEIATMSVEQQVKLLRVLEERTIVRLGSHKEIPVDIRIISATNLNLYKLVEASSFRKDLYYRLATFVIDIPPLRERKEDIPLLLEHFVRLFSYKLNKPIKKIEKSIEINLMNYSFPGNVRELKNLVERAIIVADSATLKYSHFSIPENIINNAELAISSIKTLAEIEKEHILGVLKSTNFNQSKAAEILGVERRVVARKMQKYAIENLPVQK